MLGKLLCHEEIKHRQTPLLGVQTLFNVINFLLDSFFVFYLCLNLIIRMNGSGVIAAANLRGQLEEKRRLVLRASKT